MGPFPPSLCTGVGLGLSSGAGEQQAAALFGGCFLEACKAARGWLGGFHRRAVFRGSCSSQGRRCCRGARGGAEEGTAERSCVPAAGSRRGAGQGVTEVGSIFRKQPNHRQWRAARENGALCFPEIRFKALEVSAFGRENLPEAVPPVAEPG